MPFSNTGPDHEQAAEQSDFFKSTTAVFGGTFDPPHIGHFQAAQGLLQNPKVKRVVALVAGSDPTTGKLIHGKLPVASDRNRYEMTKSLFDVCSNEVIVDDLEIQKSRENSRAFSTFEMIPHLNKKYGPIAMVIGTDQLRSFHTWKHYPAVLETCHWIILNRKSSGNRNNSATTSRSNSSMQETEGDPYKQMANLAKLHDFKQTSDRNLLTRSQKRMLLVDTDAKAVSSSDIRALLARPGSDVSSTLSGLVPTRIAKFIFEHKLYGT